MIRRSSLLLLTFLALVLTSPAQAQSYFRMPTLEEAEAAFGGAAVVGDGEIFIGEARSFKNPGLVHIYRRSAEGGWMADALLKASDGAVNDGFGGALALAGRSLLIGATEANEGRGTAYVFEQQAGGAWAETTMLSTGDVADGDQFGSALAMSEGYAMVGAPAHNERAGAVYVFQREADGSWTEQTKLVGAGVEQGHLFGAVITMDGDRALISAPMHEGGGVFIYQRGADGMWIEAGKLVGSDVEVTSSFGAALYLHGNELVIGAPQANQFLGEAHVFGYDAASQTWTAHAKLEPTGEGERDFFGAAIQGSGDELWIGAPGTGGFAGLLYRFRRDGDGLWTQAETWVEDGVKTRDFFAGAFAVNGNVGVVGITGDDYGEGSAVIVERSPETGAWEKKTAAFNQLEGMDPITGNQVDCDEGTAASFDCSNVDLISFLPLQDIGAARGVRLNDVWGWTDPESGTEYALVGHLEGTVFINLSDPYNPVYLGELPRTDGTPGSTWRDIKVYKDHAYIVADGADAHGVQVFDLTQLRNVQNPPVTFEATAHYDGIHSSHNIVINEETGFAYAVGNGSGGETCGGGLHMIDIREPAEPTFAGCFADPTTGRRKTGYSHDAQCVIYHGPDTEHQGKEICLGSNETAISISDVTDKDNPVPIGSGSYPDFAYVHQGWLTEDHRYFYQNDEGDEINGKAERTRTLIWDVSDLDDPVMVKAYFGEASSTDHNLYIKDNLMYQTNNASGLRIIDISDPENPVEVGFFDTTPYGYNVAGFNGTWSSYPYFESGMIVVTSRREGVFILKKRQVDI